MRDLNGITITLLISLLFVLSACSGMSKDSHSPVEPPIDGISAILDNTPDTSIDTHNRVPIAYYEAVIDPEAQTFSITPISRSVNYHFPLTQMYPGCLQITAFGFVPNFWADIKLVHPLPGSGIDVFDPRVIAILPTHWGAYFYYPTLGVYGNPKVLLEPDGYTALFNHLAPDIFGNVNPFMAYFKDEPYRRWSSRETPEDSRNWQMDLDGFGGPIHFKLVVDISTNYPNPPQQIIDNAPEPVEISSVVGPGLTPDGGSAEIEVTLLDWQGWATIGGVLVESPKLFDGTINLYYTTDGPNPHEYIFTGIITNAKLAPEGVYSYLVGAWDEGTEIYMYNEFKVEIGDTGNLMWAKRAGGQGDDRGFAVVTLSDNATVVTGQFEERATFGQGEPNQTTLSSDGNTDMFIARYEPDGTLKWAKRAGGQQWDAGYGITALSDDSVVVTGYYYGTATFGAGEPNQTTLIGAGLSDIFIARYNIDGTLNWAKSAGGARLDVGNAITTLSDDSVVLTGRFETTATFGAGEPNETILTSAGGSDIFVARYKSDGTFSWAVRAGGEENDYGNAVTTLTNDAVIITGHFEGIAIFGEGEPEQTKLTSDGLGDIYVACYIPDGTLKWAKRAGGTGWDVGEGITTLSDDSVVATGYFMSSATFGEGEPNETTLVAAGPSGAYDIFIARYLPNGSLQWAKRAGGLDHNMGFAITTLSDDSVVSTGRFEGLCVFGPSEVNETTLISAGGYDFYISRHNSSGELIWAKRAGGNEYNYGYGISSLSDNSTVATGSFKGTSIFGPGELSETVLVSDGDWDIFVARFAP